MLGLDLWNTDCPLPHSYIHGDVDSAFSPSMNVSYIVRYTHVYCTSNWLKAQAQVKYIGILYVNNQLES